MRDLGMTAAHQQHIGQRLKVGAIGLAVVVLLIVIAGAIAGAVTRDRSAPGGGAKPDAVANMATANEAAATEPLADMGVTAATGNSAAR